MTKWLSGADVSWQHRLAPLARPLPWAFLLVVVVGWQTGALAARLLDLSVATAPLEWKPPDVQTTAARHSSRYRDVRLPLFGELEDESDDASEAVPEDVPETSLNFRLVGVLNLAGTGGLANLVVAGDDGVYQPGDVLQGDVSLVAVYRDRVLLERRGDVEMLLLDRDAGAEFEIEAVSAVATTSESTVADEGSSPARDAFSDDFDLTGINLRPEFSEGRLRGIRIDAGGEKADVLASAGLRDDDTVTRVNDIVLDDIARMQEALDQLHRDEVIELEIERDGTPQVIEISPANLQMPRTGSVEHDG